MGLGLGHAVEDVGAGAGEAIGGRYGVCLQRVLRGGCSPRMEMSQRRATGLGPRRRRGGRRAERVGVGDLEPDLVLLDGLEPDLADASDHRQWRRRHRTDPRSSPPTAGPARSALDPGPVRILAYEQRRPGRAVPVRPCRADRLDHELDQLVGHGPDTRVASQAGGLSRGHPLGHLPQPMALQVRATELRGIRPRSRSGMYRD
jgi:hypothetical protein